MACLARGRGSLLFAFECGSDSSSVSFSCSMTSEPSISLPPMETTASGLLVPSEPAILRVATYNIHKGVQGLGPTRRLEIHNLGLAVEQLDADIVCLQEVRKMNRREANYFENWPQVG